MVQPGEVSDSVSADSSCPATSDASSSTKINQTFINKKLNVRLDEKNFLQWKQQVFLTVCSHGLEKFLTGEVTVPSAKDRILQKISGAHCYACFSTKFTTKICDTLAASGNSLSEIEHVATILNGLPVEYDPFIAVIAASREPVSLEGYSDFGAQPMNGFKPNCFLSAGMELYRPPRPVPATNMCAFTSAVPVFLDNVLPSYGSSIAMSADRSVLGPLVQSSTARAI
ncbi:hypothetical protein CXB51_002394 [Gossypium anomalum]|uniref:Uncharacterized protein n=1 Tax=Gossypium anomalum TaxID=47600 RepID=A0A8J5ZME9_9ROSI|nr:hypothetical protein CXB51_002394 [Gossypium anomalum]